MFKNNYGRLIDFLSRISNLFYFELLDLGDFLMHITSFVIWCGNPGCATVRQYSAHVCLQSVVYLCKMVPLEKSKYAPYHNNFNIRYKYNIYER